ncbi:MAG TPA: OsmC family protein [Gammaproteobacteria bacterium]|nr:OsmC family protein [Gammaproteobacteria bacterium]
MRVEVDWLDGMAFEARGDSGHKVLIDASPDVGGKNRGSRPMEILLMGLGGCSSIDVMLMLKKSRQDVTNCKAVIEAKRADTVPAVFTHIHVHFIVKGRGLSAKHIERAVKLSAEKYCSASIMLSQAAEMTHDFEVLEAD